MAMAIDPLSSVCPPTKPVSPIHWLPEESTWDWSVPVSIRVVPDNGAGVGGIGVLVRAGIGVLVRVGSGVLVRAGTGVLVRAGIGVLVRADTGVLVRVAAGGLVGVDAGVFVRAGTGVLVRVAAGVGLLLTPGRRRDLLWLAAPAIALAAWYVAFGRFGQHPNPQPTAANLLIDPLYTVWGLSQGLAGIIGASGWIGYPLLAAAIAAVAWSWWRQSLTIWVMAPLPASPRCQRWA